jgi:hypothetical protein
VVIFFRAPSERGIYKKPIELSQKPTNPYMGWATPPTSGKGFLSCAFIDTHDEHFDVRQNQCTTNIF